MNNENVENSEDKFIFQTLLRPVNYLVEFYQIREKVEYNKNYEKIFACSRDQNLNVVISKQSFDFTNKNINERLTNIIKFLENNLVLLENLWITEESIDNELNESKYELKNRTCHNTFSLTQSN